ncbi:hypothetical protein B9Z55_023948 [Caenorhabditis nigoni]|nr:hypothetical protein B9Z55_023948 [Caenorhabditis nigoni]
MRRAAGSHIRTDRQKLALLQRTTLSSRQIAPSLRSNHVRKLLASHEQATKLVDALHTPSKVDRVIDRPPVTRRHTSR